MLFCFLFICLFAFAKCGRDEEVQTICPPDAQCGTGLFNLCPVGQSCFECLCRDAPPTDTSCTPCSSSPECFGYPTFSCSLAGCCELTPASTEAPTDGGCPIGSLPCASSSFFCFCLNGCCEGSQIPPPQTLPPSISLCAGGKTLCFDDFGCIDACIDNCCTPSLITNAPTFVPTAAPTTNAPTAAPTTELTGAPTAQPTTTQPTSAPTTAPTNAPTMEPTNAPTAQPTQAPTSAPTNSPTMKPTNAPTAQPTTGTPTKEGDKIRCNTNIDCNSSVELFCVPSRNPNFCRQLNCRSKDNCPSQPYLGNKCYTSVCENRHCIVKKCGVECEPTVGCLVSSTLSEEDATCCGASTLSSYASVDTPLSIFIFVFFGGVLAIVVLISILDYFNIGIIKETIKRKLRNIRK